MSILKHQLRQPIIILLIALVAITTVAAIFHAPINRQMHHWKLLPEPERLTELYFADPNHLPTTYTPDGQQIVSFTVHNLEYRTMTYHYIIVESGQDGSQSQTLNEGTFTLRQDENRKTSVTISTPDLGPDVKVEVKLVNRNESIHYLLRRDGP